MKEKKTRIKKKILTGGQYININEGQDGDEDKNSI